jgi:hypothetical protein
MNEVRTIDLHLPRGWNDCTTRELEMICASILLRTQQASRLRPFDWVQVKVDVVLSINDLQVIGDASDVRGLDPGSQQTRENVAARDLSPDIAERPTSNERASSGDARGQSPGRGPAKVQSPGIETPDVTWMVRRRHRKRFRREEPFPITTGQMMELCGRLDWIDAPQDRQKPLYRFPYPVLRLGLLHEYHGPDVMLDGYSWTEYRHLQDWMQAYITSQNRLLQLQSDRRTTASRYALALAAVDDARAHFLAVLFRARMALTDGDRAARAFRDFDPIKWQVILLWWSSLMQQLMKKFPRVFKPQDVGNGRRKQPKQQSPWDFYNHVTATLADEYKTSESEQANETYSVTLQKLENMAEKAAELEKLSRKK